VTAVGMTARAVGWKCETGFASLGGARRGLMPPSLGSPRLVPSPGCRPPEDRQPPRDGARSLGLGREGRDTRCVGRTWGLGTLPSGGEPCVWAYRQANEPTDRVDVRPRLGWKSADPTRPEGGTRFRWTGLVVVRLVWRPVCQGHTCGGRCGGSRTADREVSVDLADILNALGSQDWELTSAVPTTARLYAEDR